MKTFIFLAGAPGSGKSSVASALQRKLDSPMFEFGWIPEFRNTGAEVITYSEDEALAFENLTLVLKNYASHGFKNIIVTDLENKRIGQIGGEFEDFEYIVFTLRILDDSTLKSRVLDSSRTSGYRDWQESLNINHGLLARKPFKNECFIDLDKQSVQEVVQLLATLI